MRLKVRIIPYDNNTINRINNINSMFVYNNALFGIAMESLIMSRKVLPKNFKKYIGTIDKLAADNPISNGVNIDFL